MNETRDRRLGLRWVALVVLVLVTGHLAAGCAYFNTLYNARQKYDEAQVIKRRADPERTEITTQEERLYEEAFEKAAKVAKYYADSKWVDDALLLMGQAAFEKGDYSTAIRKFEEIETFFPDSRLLDEAFLMKGRTLVAVKEYDAALTALRRAEEITDDKWRGDIDHFLGMAQQARDERDLARASFLRVLEHHKGSEFYGQAGLVLGESLVEEGDLVTAVSAFERARSGGKTPGERFRGGLRKGETLLELGEYEEARKTFRKLAKDTIDEEDSGEARVAEARTVLAMGEREESVLLFNTILEEDPRSEAAAEAQYQIARMFDDDGEYVRAQEEYEKVREAGTGHPAWRKASDRQNEIQTALDLREAIASADEQEPERKRYLLAEHLLERIGDTEAALVEYETLAADAHRTEWGARALYAQAWIYEHRLAQPDTAESLLYRLANYYSGTEVDAAARRRFGFPVWKVERIEAPPIVYVRSDDEKLEGEDIVVSTGELRQAELPADQAEATVWVRVALDEAGIVTSAKVTKSDGGDDCDEAALAAARETVFRSQMEGGPAFTVLQYEFPVREETAEAAPDDAALGDGALGDAALGDAALGDGAPGDAAPGDSVSSASPLEAAPDSLVAEEAPMPSTLLGPAVDDSAAVPLDTLATPPSADSASALADSARIDPFRQAGPVRLRNREFDATTND